MALEQQIQNDIAVAMKARDQVRLDALRAVKSAILIAKTAGAGIELTDAEKGQWVEAIGTIYPDFYDVCGEDLINSIIEYQY